VSWLSVAQRKLNAGKNCGARKALVSSQVLGDKKASQYVSGTAVHWYFDDDYPSSRLTEVHDLFPDKFILYTEASFGEY
jgi:O-glycosyl hydrolase